MSTEASLLPSLAAAKMITTHKKKPKVDPETEAISTLCKTLNATVMKLIYSNAALMAEQTMAPDGTQSGLTLALAASKREELSAKICETLAMAVEKVVRCNDVAMRSHIVRDLRARFEPKPEKPKPEMVDESTQCVIRKPKVSLLAAAAAAHVAQESPPVRMAAPAGPSDDDILKALRGEGGPAAEAAAEPPPNALADQAMKNIGLSSAKDIVGFARALTESDAKNNNNSNSAANVKRPVSAAAGLENSGGGNAKLPGIYERQMMWQAKAAERKERLLLEKENKEREAEKPVRSKASAKWAHVESVMKRERLQEEAGWKQEMQDQMQAERDRRDRAELKAKEEREAKEKLAVERDAAEAKRKEAVERMDKYHERMRHAETSLAKEKQANAQMAQAHAEEIEIRDAFGERGLESWPMFPGRRVHRVLESDEFDGRVSQEFRTKDSESGERGVTLLMGRLASGKVAECQAVLFDTKYLSDLQAARWFAEHKPRFERVKERIESEKQRRATSAGSRRQSITDLT